MKRYGRPIIEIAGDALLAFAAYYWFGWIGFALVALFVIGWFLIQLIGNQQVIMKTLQTRLPERCTFCHGEIVNEGVIFDDEGTYHENCLDKLDSLEELRKEAGVSASEAIHRPRERSHKTDS